MTRVKICGVRRREDALLAAELGADALGFVFWPDSPRFIDPYRALKVLPSLAPFVATIGVFVDQPREYVEGVAQLLNLTAVQLHGSEPPGDYPPRRRVIKAVPVTDSFDPSALPGTVPRDVMVLLDAHDPIRRGGTGRKVDWSQAAAAARLRPVILSGGLTAANVGTAIAAVGPYAVDVSSGVESAPGIKDPEKLRAFFAAVSLTAARALDRQDSNYEQRTTNHGTHPMEHES
jgi:phosphoribosylanthranilate isomerase